MSSFTGNPEWTFSASGNGTPAVDFSGGIATLSAFGTFGSGTLKWQASTDNGTTYIDIANATGTAAYEVNMMHGPCKIRPVLSGATNPTLTAKAAPVPGV